MSEAQTERITCATYTHARRHPMVLGKIGDWTPPIQLTLPQIGVFLLVLFIQVQTWGWWGDLLPRGVGIVVFLGVPLTCAWTVRRARWEGRSLPRAVMGWISLLVSSSRQGAVGGRPYSTSRPQVLHRVQVYVESAPPRRPTPSRGRR